MVEWKWIEGYEGHYKISSDGQVESVPRVIRFKSHLGNDVERPLKGGLLTLKDDKNGYKYVILSRDGEPKTCKVHRLVAAAFSPNEENKPQVNHKNGIKSDNRIDNLEWVTDQENHDHAARVGLVPSGERHCLTKMTNDQAADARRRMNNGESRESIAIEFGLSSSAIGRLARNETFTLNSL